MRALYWLVALVVVALLGGCVSPPSSGPILEGLDAPVAAAPDPLVRPIANPPRPGMEPTEIVAGFLDAAAAVGDDFSIARQYLAPQAAAEWDPGAGVTVTATLNPRIESVGQDVVAVRTTAVGSISPSGVYADLPATPVAVDVGVGRVDGEWRITAAPRGLLLAREEVDRTFGVRNAYFIDPGSRWAVPDVRMVPRTGAQAQATALVTALLAGPSQWLAGSVITAIPDGLQLAFGAVPVDNGLARVELAGPQPVLDEAASQRFGAQLAWTLGQVPQIEAFEVLLGGRPLPLREQRGPIPLDEYASFDPDVLRPPVPLFGVGPAGSAVEVLDGSTAALAEQPTGPDGSPVPLSSIAVTPGAAVFAGVAADRTAVFVGRTDGERGQGRWIEGQVAAGPAIDATGRVWWTDPAGRAVAATPDPGGGYQVVEIAAPDAPGPIASVRPARDGTRAVVILGTGSAARAYLAAVVPGVTGPQLLGVRPLGDLLGVVDAAWHTADQVTLLAPAAELVQRTDLLGGDVGAFSVPATATTVTDAPGMPVVLGLSGGTAGRLTGTGVRTIDQLAVPAYPG